MYVVRCSGSDAALLGIDRDAEHSNTRAAFEAGAGAEVFDYRPDLGVLVIGFLPGGRWTTTPSPTRGCCGGRGLPAAPRGPALRRRLRHVRPPGGVPADGAERDSPCRRRTTTTRTRGRRSGSGDGPAPGTVPCNNDLLAGNFIDDGERIWLIDYEYSGNHDAAFELGNTCTECEFPPERVEAYAEAYYGAPTRGDLARVRLGALRSAYGWALWGFIQAASSPLDFDFHGWGMHRFEKAAGRSPPTRSTGCWRRPPVTDLPARARVVVIGGGVMGCSTAYHLVKLGWSDVLLLEQGHLSGGSTWHAAGLVGPLRAPETGTRLVQYSAELYARLEAETGLATGYRGVGGVIVARTGTGWSSCGGRRPTRRRTTCECRLLTPERGGELWPPMRVDDLLGAIHLPGDGKVNPTDLTQSLARGARQGGAVILEGVRVTGFDVADGPRRPGHRRQHGAGRRRGRGRRQLCRPVGEGRRGAGARRPLTVPLHSAEHFYVVTEGSPASTPTCRSCATRTAGPTSRKRSVASWSAASSRTRSRGWRRTPSRTRSSSSCSRRTGSTSRCSSRRRNAGCRRWRRGDPEVLQRAGELHPGQPVPAGGGPGLRGFFVGAGFNSVGIASAGGAGRALAEWVVAGEPTSDLVAVDVRRFAPCRGRRRWLRARVAEILGQHYEVPWPCASPGPARGVRRSPLHDRLSAAERPSARGWDGSGRTSSRRPAQAEAYSWDKPAWLPLGGRRAACHADGGGRLRPDVVLQVRRRAGPARSTRCSGCAPPTSTCRSASASTRRC